MIGYTSSMNKKRKNNLSKNNQQKINNTEVHQIVPFTKESSFVFTKKMSLSQIRMTQSHNHNYYDHHNIRVCTNIVYILFYTCISHD